jgi:hypothetical protein
MQYPTILLALLSSSALASPWGNSYDAAKDNSIIVLLEHKSVDIASQTPFTEGVADEKKPTGSFGPYTNVTLTLGKDVVNKELRCKILDKDQKAIVLTRGPNVDVTFADGGKGDWAFRKGESEVSDVICDPLFTKIGPEGKEIRVILSNPAKSIKSETVFTDMAAMHRQMLAPKDNNGPFTTVELKVGEVIEKQDLRCQIVDSYGHAIIVKRGENVDVTFADGGKKEWTFLKPVESQVHSITCDPAFAKTAVPIHV